MKVPTEVALFAYGTLQQAEVQLATYGRLLDGMPDTLSGYRLDPLTISDAEVIRVSGKPVHFIARASGDPADRIPGMVFSITDAELAATDAYEIDAYDRTEVLLDSGTRAFAYGGPELESV